jgi:nickel-dependent lactate racemase
MRIEVPYGEGKEAVEVRDENLGEVVYQKDVFAEDKVQIVLDAANTPLNSQPLPAFLKGAMDVIIIVNDATRPTPSWKIIKVIQPFLKGLKVKYIVATGMHRAPTEEEYRFIFGELYKDIKADVYAHDAKHSETVMLGTSMNGTPLKLNKMVVDADRIIVISSVEPHYFAGYTGGRKSFLPGVSAYETIEKNHKLALSIDAQSLKLEKNPVNEDMEDAMRALKDKKIFSIMVVLDKNHRTCFAFAGNLRDSFRAATKKADEVFVIKLKKKSDIVVAVTAFPYDIDLYQSQKALDNAKYAVRDGGIIILVSACRDGVGPPNFLDLLGSASTPKEALDKIAQGYKLGYHKAAKMAEIGLKCKMLAVTKLDPYIARKAHLTPVNTLQEAIDVSIRELGPRSKVTFMMDAVITVPRVQQAQ